ncbi:hypothetical protein GCM10017667_29930 [Streptomyces filamentosus]|uniref:Lipoprotein n=1 Tax=Streptomyces filamentosus TaxID=67294 RepID=A0A919ELS0_STRFL|nr:hypothetical protein GCM10017667_29930 [Streptomyces filamentosus]
MTDRFGRWGREIVRRGGVAVGGVVLLAGGAGCGAAGGGVHGGPASEAASEAASAEGGAGPAREAPPLMVLRGKDAPVAGLLRLLTGTLVVTEENCVAVRSGTGGKIVALDRGHGWTARVEDGRAVVRDDRGEVFAREGDEVGLGGGTSGRTVDHPCAGSGVVFSVDNAPVDE